MKTLIVFLLMCANGIYAQEWKQFHRTELGLTTNLVTTDYATGGRHFRINRYDNSLWFASNLTIQTISSNGVSAYFRKANTPPFPSTNPFWLTFEFLPNKVFLLAPYQGLFLYENNEWSSVHNPSGTTPGMAMENDTLYILRENQAFVKWMNGMGQALYNSGTATRIVTNNNHFWMSNGIGSTGLFFYSEIGDYDWYGPSNSLMMDNGNYDFKFSPHNDTLYVAGDKGLSMLYNLTFFDSIAPDNTTNMPAGVIMDFEFDADDNIWALFGSDAQTPVSIAHYDQSTKTWDAYYDVNNSDLNFDTYSSIEMDNLGNLWMVNSSYIHVLELTFLPEWLSVKQPSQQLAVLVYPNPVECIFYIETDAIVSEMYLTDQLGKRIKTLDPNEKQFSISEFPVGVYFVTIIGSDAVGTVKLLKE